MVKKKTKDLFNLIILITVVFTILDYIIHYFGFLVPILDNLPDNYFIYKIIGLPIILYILMSFFKLKGHLLYGITALTLQVRYYFSYLYDVKTNIIMLIVHYILIFLSFELIKRFGKGKI